MKLERVSSVVYARAVAPSAGEKSRLPTPGDTVLLICEETAGQDLLASVDGVTVRLPGAEQWAQGLKPGDTVLIRVLRTDPLQFELYGPPSRAGNPTEDFARSFAEGQAAMRLDQAALSQVAWHTANAAVLAKTWERLAQARWTELPQEQGPPSAREATLRPRSTNFEPWGFPVYTQDGRQMTLGLAEASDESNRNRRARQRKPLALRLALTAPALGRLVLEIQWAAGGGIQLTIAVEQVESLPTVRATASAIAVALGRVNLRLVRCRLIHGSASHERLGKAAVDPFRAQSFEETLSPQLFRALAEAAVVLMESVTPGSPRY